MLVVYDVINTIVFVILVSLFIGTFLQEKRVTSYCKGLIICLWSLIEIIIVNVFADVFLIKALFTVISSCIFGIVLYRDNKYKVILLATIQYILELVIEFFAYMIAIKFTGYVHLLDASQTLVSIYAGVLSQLLYLLIIIALIFFFKDSNYKQLKPLELLKFLVFPMISVSLIFAFIYFSDSREISSGEIKFYTYFSICILIANIYMFWLLKIDVNNKITIENNRITNEHAMELKNLYTQITEEHKEISGVEHEYKNHISVINSLVFSNKYDELKTYLKNNKMSPVYTDVVDTGNSIASAVLNAKYAEAMRKGIQVRFDLTNLASVAINDSDLVIILSNLFNNAIEACEKVEGKKLIEIKINNMNGLLFISFSNTISNEMIANNPEFKTTKIDTKHHGYGISNIRRIINTHSGTIEIEHNRDLLSIRIVIPCEIII